MADPQNSTGQSKEFPMEVRLLLACVLVILVLFLTPYFYKPVAPGPTQKAPNPKPAAAAVQPPPTPAAQAAANAPATPPPGQISASSEQTFTINTDLFEVRFSNRGALVQSWLLKKYRDNAGKPLELVNTQVTAKIGSPFEFAFDHAPATDPNKALFAAKQTADGLGIDFEYSDGKSLFRKSFHFAKDSYLSQITTEAQQNGQPLPHLLSWRGGFGDLSVRNAPTTQHGLYFDVSDNKLVVKSAKDAKKGPIIARGDFSFAGLEDTYFAAVFLPKQEGSLEAETLADNVPTGTDNKTESWVGVSVGGDPVNRFAAFVGPKDVNILGAVDPKLKQLIDWGWFWFIAKPLFIALNWANEHFTHNFGWAIVVVTIVINLLLLPARFSSLKSTRRMQALQPKIKAINDKYKNVSLRDPKKAEQNQEVMDLYKKEGVNPTGGCLPMLVQLPLVYAMYRVLSVSIQLRGAHWLWVTDLSQPEQLAIRILPTIMVVTQFVLQRMTPNPSADPAQQRMMMFMPLAFGFFFYYYQSGLVLYWLVGNLVGIAQQYLMNRMSPPPVPPPAPAPVARKKVRS
jgi:YidC/Oxa1 family membrane protein insertase